MSAADDKTVSLWDIRKDSKPCLRNTMHNNEIYSVAFSPFNEYLFLTSSGDKTIKLFDLRFINNSLHTFHSHLDSVLRVEWSHSDPAIFASCGLDRRVMIWDATKIAIEKHPEAPETPSELVFVHGGHRS